MINKFAVTFTGGVDSTVLSYWLAKEYPGSEIWLLACNYGQANWCETWRLLLLHSTAINLSHSTNVRALSVEATLPLRAMESPLHRDGFVPPEASPHHFDYTEQKRTYDYAFIDGRNAFLFLHMLCTCSKLKIPFLFTGHQLEPKEWENIDSYRHRTEDFTPMFLDRMNLLQEVGFSYRVRLEAPFVTRAYSKLEICKMGLDLGINLSKDTYSCQFYPKCGKCDNCCNVDRTFQEIGIDPQCT